MGDDVDIAAVENAIRDVAAECFGGQHIIEVTARRKVDWDGDPFLYVTVVFDKERLDPEKTVAMTRHVRSSLENLGEFTFPLLSFMSKADAKGLQAAAR